MGTARVVVGFLSRMRSDGGRRNGFVFWAFSLSRPGASHTNFLLRYSTRLRVS